MKTGWILGISDTHANDKALKFISGDKDRADSKRNEYQSRYNSLEKARYQVRLESQYSEITPENTIRFKCLLKEGYTPVDLSNDLDMDLFQHRSKTPFHRFEVEAHEFDKCRDLLESLDAVIDYELEINRTR